MIEMAIFYCFIFLLAQIILLTVTKAERNVIKAKIQTDEGEVLSLKWTKAESYLANENLPIWTALKNNLQLNPEVMRDIGKFTPYYDLEKSSAILVLEKGNCIYGIIDLRYYIVCLRLNELSDPHRTLKNTPGKVFLLKADGNILPEHVIPSSPNSISNNRLSEFKMLIKSFTIPDEYKNQRLIDLSEYDHFVRYKYEEKIIEVYPELLVIIPHAKPQVRQDVVAIVIEYLVQFNAVAMLFAKLASHNIRIHINIAAIIIDMHSSGSSSMSSPVAGPPGKFLLDTIIEDVNRYQTYGRSVVRRRVFNDDSYDFFIYTTPLPWQEREEHPGGFSTPVFDVLEMKTTRPRLHHSKHRLGSIVDSSNILNLYSYTAREIAHLMSVEDDPLDYSCNSDRRCHNIMSPYSKCPNCLTWSSISIESFKKYLSTNRNRCYLLNHPRSLRPFDTPAKTLIPADQCLCYQFVPSRDLTHLNSGNWIKSICRNKLLCSIPPQYRLRRHPFPIDGTPCDPVDENKVCWAKECISIPRPTKK